MIRAPYTRRPAVTLIELLVVITIIIVLAAIAILVFPRFGESHAVHRSADRVSGWLFIAKQQARRDLGPRGVRFILRQQDPATPTYWACTEAQYIEVPEPWVPNPLQEANPNGPRIVFVYRTNPADNTVWVRQAYFFSSTAADYLEFDQRVTAGDTLLHVPELGGPYRIVRIDTPSSAPPSPPPGFFFGPLPPVPVPPYPPGWATDYRLLTLETYPQLGAAHSGPWDPGVSPPTFAPATLVTYKFSFQLGPRPLMGEPILQLGTNTIIDYRSGQTSPPFPAGSLSGEGYRDWYEPPPTAPATVNSSGPYHPRTTSGVILRQIPFEGTFYFDVIFSPSGQVINNPNGLVCLWVRNPDKVPHPRLDLGGNLDTRAVYDAAGDQVLVCVTTRTGFIASHMVAPPPPPPMPADPYQYAKDGLNTGY